MSKLAFSGEGRYPDFTTAYGLYCRRCRTGNPVDEKTYRAVVRKYCGILSDRLLSNGAADFPNGMGTVTAAVIRRKPQFRGKKFIGFGAMDWENGHYDGTIEAFGLVFLPNRTKSENLRCYGFVANRGLFKKMKELWKSDYCPWVPLDFEDSMV